MGIEEVTVTYYEMKCDRCRTFFVWYDELITESDELVQKVLDRGWVQKRLPKPKFGLYYTEWLCPECRKKEE